MTSTAAPSATSGTDLLRRLAAPASTLLGLMAAGVGLYVLPWAAGGGQALLGYEVIGYLNAHTYDFDGSPSLALYYVSMGTFVFLGASALLSLTTGSRSRRGRLVAASFTLLAVLLLAAAAWGLFASADPRPSRDEYDFALVGTIMAVVAVVVLADVVALAAGAVRVHHGFALAFVVTTAALHAFVLLSLRIDPGSMFELKLFAWVPVAGYLLAAAGVATGLVARLRLP
ncbi:hypothetical protein [Catellatospora citrea]|uniref:DUF998 domain-containing protein n=1 Tax=Catellatospora citrea TaxID=53366 RepID=A0A8J3NYX4_9ACTN|nr:hypothetical protein [Catellatospora citrea]RKE06071.1 hypothetical protein C8E86_0889 [Catellatospora citrea]GIF97737.1 hypothetical protein Cci01nite_28310 [Catellatospora citrea]